MVDRKGSISVKTNDIFPIIKKWLYSEHDIFIRELVANATDAITKRATLGRNLNHEVAAPEIRVVVNKKEKTITITDNGLGMSEADVEKYIAQLAFSGAEEFVKKMKDTNIEKGGDIIGKFGLGFYSTFMVANLVEIDSLSMNEGSAPTHWSCKGDTEYTFSASTKNTIGTTITLHLNEESMEFLDKWKLQATLKNFCSFMPYPIFVADSEDKAEDNKDSINDTNPLWKKDPATLKDEDYKEFFRKLYPAEQEPLFWLHLKVDHPFTLEGVLFFPKINFNRPFSESNIKLYCKQVFVSDNVKSIVPDFLNMLKGVIDSTDIPLNVSRSSLQGDPNVKKISNYIIKKVAESLKKLYATDRARYETIWEDIGIFVKYGSISDTKFDEIMRERVIFKNSENKFATLSEYTASIPSAYTDKMKAEDVLKVVYFEKLKSDIALRTQLLSEGIHAIETDDHIDPHYLQHVETHKLENQPTYKFNTIDSEIGHLLASENTNEDDIKVKELFSKFLVGEAPKDENPMAGGVDIEIGKLKNAQAPAFFKIDEQMKRFSQMAKSMGNSNMFPVKKTLVINPNNNLIKNAMKIWQAGKHPLLVEKICHHVEDLATISSEGLKHDEKEMFVKRTQELIEELSTLAL
jgi:molecular chaperone HtpG